MDEVKNCIGLWKGSLIPPKNAGHKYNQYIEKIYDEFENVCILKNAVSYDDFVPIAVGILKNEKNIRQHENRYNIVIVDEYQDINYGQQRLIELIAGNNADVMLVGDDDQTIYEWRGARTEYILNRYKETFSGKSFLEYTLSHSFRFGPELAQCAENVISLNKKRSDKHIISYDFCQKSDITLFSGKESINIDSNNQIATEIPHLVRETGGDPRNIIVLARIYSQLSGLEIEFMKEKIPYRIIGRKPFFMRREITALLDYLYLGINFDEPIDSEVNEKVRSILNMPNRKLPKRKIENVLNSYKHQNATLRDFFSYLTDRYSPLTHYQIEKIKDLFEVLTGLHAIIHKEDAPFASILIESVINCTDYYGHFENYYGKGEASEDRKLLVENFVQYSKLCKLSAKEFLLHINSMDITHGVQEDEQIVMTTVHRVKGQEYDFVIIPECRNGNMPCIINTTNPIFDKSGTVKEPENSEHIENERRLFYVAITRAKKGVLIGCPGIPDDKSKKLFDSNFISEMNLEATKEIFNEFERVIEDRLYDKTNLENKLIKYAGSKCIINNMQNHYLKNSNIILSDETIEKIEFKQRQQLSLGAQPIIKSSMDRVDRKWWDEEI